VGVSVPGREENRKASCCFWAGTIHAPRPQSSRQRGSFQHRGCPSLSRWPRRGVTGTQDKSSRPSRTSAWVFSTGAVEPHAKSAKPRRGVTGTRTDLRALRVRYCTRVTNKASRVGREVKLPACTASSSRPPAWDRRSTPGPAR